MEMTRKNLVVFGYGLGLISAILGIGGLVKHGWGWAPLVLLVCSGVFIAVTALNWEALKPGYQGWMKVTGVIGTLVTSTILGLVFFLVFVPIRLCLRLGGKDHLKRKMDFKGETYWEARPTTAFDKKSYVQQY